MTEVPKYMGTDFLPNPKDWKDFFLATNTIISYDTKALDIFAALHNLPLFAKYGHDDFSIEFLWDTMSQVEQQLFVMADARAKLTTWSFILQHVIQCLISNCF